MGVHNFTEWRWMITENRHITSNINLPNAITSLRIVGAAAMLFLEPFSFWFFATFIICGLSDAVDGIIARAMNCCTDFGTKLDSVADLSFYSVMLLRVLPFLWTHLPKYVFVYAGAVIAVRLVCYIYVGVKHRKFASIHTYANKLTGFSLFIVPLVAPTPLLLFFSLAVCTFGAYSSVEELLIHLFSKSYNSNTKSIFLLKKDM